MAWSPYRCNDHKYWSFTRNICNRYVHRFKILFEALSQACLAMVTTIWRPSLRNGAGKALSQHILVWCKVHSLSSGKVTATSILIIHPIAIFAFYSLNYSLATRLQDNCLPKSPTKVETKRKSHKFTVSGCLIMN